MALFGSKKKTSSTSSGQVEKKVQKTEKISEGTSLHNTAGVIRRPRITEKASMQAEANVYAFEVATDANKKTIAHAVKELYNVTPIKVAVVTLPKKEVFIRGKWGTKGGGKKAYVYLKKGETIEFV
jgi:large subunit ribosomal protein L23